MRETLEHLPLSKITPAEDNPRRELGDLDELAASIAAFGILEPLVVTPNGKGYVLVCGARRLAAAKKAGLEEAPAIVRELDERGRQEAMLIENLQREDLGPLEEASAFQRLVELGLAQRELAAHVGRSQSHISKRLALLELPEKIREAVDSGRITLDDAQELLRLKDLPKRLEAAWKEAGGRSYSIDYAVRRQLQEHKDHEKVAKARERLKKAGVRQVELVKDERYHTLGLPRGVRVIQKGGGYTNLGQGDALDVDPGKHAEEDCHGAAVLRDYQAGEIVYVCTNPKGHPEAVRKATRGKTNQKSAKYQAHEKALREAAKARRAFLTEVVHGRHAKPEIVGLLVDGLIEMGRGDTTQIALDLLGLEPVVTKHDYFTEKDRETPLRDFAGNGGEKQIRVGLALALAEQDWLTTGAWRGWTDRQPYFDFLAAHGYEISDAEKLELAGKAPRPNF